MEWMEEQANLLELPERPLVQGEEGVPAGESDCEAAYGGPPADDDGQHLYRRTDPGGSQSAGCLGTGGPAETGPVCGVREDAGGQRGTAGVGSAAPGERVGL